MKTFLQNMVMLHIKLNGMKRMTKCKHIFCPYIYFDSLSEVKMSKHFFFNLTMLQKGWSCIYNGHLYHGLVVGGGGGGMGRFSLKPVGDSCMQCIAM